MGLITRFETPAKLRDIQGSTFYDNWHAFVDNELDNDQAGPNGGAFYNPARTDVNIAAAKIMTWMALPRRVLLPNNRDDKTAVYKICDQTNRKDPNHAQDEYFEWFVHRNQAKKITKVTFVTELRYYYEELWQVDPNAVVKVYKKYVSPQVKKADLQKPDGSYDYTNDWNTSRGILHYTRLINSLGAAIGLAKDFESRKTVDNYASTPPFATTTTSVDPRVNYDIHMLERKKLFVTLKEPIGIYIVDWDNTGITRPDGRPAPRSWWKIRRGKKGMVLRLDYEVPKNLGFVVGDLTLGGHPVKYGAQLAEQITVGLPGVAGA